MPRRNQVTSLIDLSTRSFARNLNCHSVMFLFSKIDKRFHRYYKHVQKMVGDSVVDQLRYIRDHGNLKSGNPLCDLFAFLFDRDMEKFCDVEHMLNFIFNSFSKSFGLLLHGEFEIPDKLFTILSKCKGLQALNMSSVRFSEEQLIKTLGCWTKISVVSLLDIKCDNTMVENIFKNCLQLEEFIANSHLITDRPLFYLCNDSGTQGTIWSGICKKIGKLKRELRFQFALENPFYLCEDPMSCCRRGKKLKYLRLFGTRITKHGIAYALDHCPLLADVMEVDNIGSVIYYSHLPDSILILKNALRSKGQCNLDLKLETIYIGSCTPLDVVHNAVKCCPLLRTVILDPAKVGMFLLFEVPLLKNLILLSPPRAKFSYALREKLKHLNSFGIMSGHSFHLRNLHCILQQCPSLKRLILQNVSIENEANDPEFRIPLCSEHLTYVTLKNVGMGSESTKMYFINLLSSSTKLRSLTLSHFMVQEPLTQIMAQNELSVLEKISLYYADLQNVSLMDITGCDNHLKTIVHVQCSNTEKFVQMHKKAAQENNFNLKILSSE